MISWFLLSFPTHWKFWTGQTQLSNSTAVIPYPVIFRITSSASYYQGQRAILESRQQKKNNKTMTTGEKQKKRSRNKAIYKILLVCINIPISTKIVESYQFVSFQETGPKKLNKKTKLIPSNFKNQGFCVKRQSVYARKYKYNLPIFFLQELFQFA